MASIIYIVVTLLLTFLAIFGFGITEPTFLNIQYWVLALLFSMAFTFGLVWVFMWLYVITIRKVDPHNMRNHRMINSILRLSFHLMNINLVVIGKENIPPYGKAFVFVCNHQENYDVLAIKPVFKDHPLNFIAKQDAFGWFILGRWIKILGNVPISRVADRSAAESIINGIKLLKEGIPMAIFPEGHRTFTNTLDDFKPGAFKLAMKPKADILVGTIYNFSMVFKGWPFKRQKIYLHIHPLLTYEDYQKMNSIELADFVKNMMQNQLDTFETMVKS